MNVKMTLRRNSPKLLTILAAMGTVSTAFATARATPKALLLIQEAEAQKGEDLTALEKVKVATVPYIPAVLLGSATIVCIFGAQMLNRKTQSSIRAAVNKINETMVYEMYAALNDFYNEIGLSNTDMGDELGWNLDDGLLEISYGAMVADDGRPCITLD